MSESLYKLVYLSRNTIGGDAEAQRREIERILAVSRQENPRVDVTGALLFSTARFAQVLEGPRQALETLFERIQGDPRHADIVVLLFEAVARRRFPKWSMGCMIASPEATRHFATLDNVLDDETRQQIGERLYTLLQEHLLDTPDTPDTAR
ncbi:BLUF domain-containing protein [Halomonas sp. WWR20]